MHFTSKSSEMEAFEVCESASRFIGKAVLISMEEKADPPRDGGEIDRNQLKEYLKDINFEVIELVDETKTTIIRTLYAIASENIADYDIFMCVIMAHGEISGAARNHCFNVARDDQMEVEEVMAMFNNARCPALSNKPKIFLINTCRGEKDGHANSPRAVNTKHSDSTKKSISATVHEERLPSGVETNLECLNRFVAYSTMDGFKSWRSPSEGSVFIYSLLRVLKSPQNQGAEFQKLMVLTTKDIMELTGMGQAIEYRAQGVTKEIHLVPNVRAVRTAAHHS